MKTFCVVISLLLAACLMAPAAFGQSLISGDVAGTVTDPSRAVIPNAGVELKSLDTGSTQNGTTNATGFYRFSLLKPGNYQVTVKQSGFATAQVPVSVLVGQTATADITLQLSTAAQTVEVTGAAPAVDTTNASINTAFTQTEFAQLPNPGGDLTNIAQSTPGAVMNVTGGYGNFTVNGLPATSNLFTVNGENDMDPYFNINNSGAVNLTMGSNEVQEATIVSNAYSGEYGQLSGAQVTYVTKSGTNAFHGNALYWWNGRTMNANDWMNNNSTPTTPRPFSNANQWAASVGGPIIKNKTFFFIDYEDIRFILPNNITTYIPSPALAAATEANVGLLQPAELPLYTRMFNLFAGAKGAGNAQALPNNASCNGLKLAGFNPATQPCTLSFESTPSALGTEWILAFKIDQNIGQNDKLFGRYKQDRGVQPTYLDVINPNFNALSNQPSWDVQIQETHIFSPNVTNEFTAAGSHYVAQFAQNEALALSTFPQALSFNPSNVNFGPQSGFAPSIVGLQFDFPQGRNITQYQFIDNVSWTRGKHSFKFGGNFRRYDVSDHNFFYNNARTFYGAGSSIPGGALQGFVEGLAGRYRQADNQFSNVPIAMWGLGVYAMDTWKVKQNLTLTLALRVERNSNPVCQKNCFANYKKAWAYLPSVEAGPDNAGNVPYTSDIAYNLHQAYPGVDSVDWSPRIGFSWSPYNNGKTVISGGFGVFYDSPASGIVDDLLANPPVAVRINVQPTKGGTLAFQPGPGGSAATFQASAQAFNAGFASGQTYEQISAALGALGVPFAAPNFTALTGTIHAPQWQEWNLQFQQQLTNSTALVVNYVGNHGIRIPYTNAWYNASNPGFYPEGALPDVTPVPNYGTVSQIQSGALSNYNGITVSIRRNFSKWVSAHANYTWAHNQDEVSNGGLFTYGDSTLTQICPGSLRQCNYGNSDYDIRNGFNGDFVVHPAYHFDNKFMNYALGGWEWSGKIFWRSGLPFSIIDGNTNGSIPGATTSTTLGYPIAPGNAPGQMSCGSGAASVNGTATPCLNAAAFINSGDPNFVAYPGFSPQRRNQYVGPHFFDMDMALFKTFKIGERVQFGVGAQAYNVFNHPNFSNPDNFLGDSTFGMINTMQNMPTSPYGSFLGFDSSVRVVQVAGKIIF
jgi:Carboxypeptidase regulatory-like domain